MPVGDREPFVKFGGDPKPALDAIRKVSDAFKTFKKAGEGAAKGLSKAFKGLSTAMRGLVRFMTGAFARAWRLTKIGIVGVVGAITAATVAWNKEAAAQARINTILRNNIKNWRGARKELDAMIRSTQRLTNFGDRDVETVFMNLMGQLGQRGFGAGRQLLRPILDVSAALGIPVQTAAEAVARNIGAGTVGETFRRFGVRTPVEQFRRMGIEQRVAVTARDIGAFAGGAAERERQANPFRGLMNNLGDILEGFGRPVAQILTPAMERAAQAAQAFADAFNPQSIGDLLKFIRIKLQALFAGIVAAMGHIGGNLNPFRTAAAHTAAAGVPGYGAPGIPVIPQGHTGPGQHAAKLRRRAATRNTLTGIQMFLKKVGPFKRLSRFAHRFKQPSAGAGGAFLDAFRAKEEELGIGDLFQPAPDQGGGGVAAPQGVMQFAGMPRAQHIAQARRNARGRDARVAGMDAFNTYAAARIRGAAMSRLNQIYEKQGFVSGSDFEVVTGEYPTAFETQRFRTAARHRFPRGPGLAAIDSFGLHNKRGALMAVQ